MNGIAYMVKARINGETAANIVFVSPEFEKDASEDTFRGAMRSSIEGIVAEKYGKDAEYELTWERGEPASIALS